MPEEVRRKSYHMPNTVQIKTRAASVCQDHFRNYGIHDCGKRTSFVLYSLKVALRMTRLAQEAIVGNTSSVRVYDALFKNVPLVEVSTVLQRVLDRAFAYQSKEQVQRRAIICVTTFVPHLSQYDREPEEMYRVCRDYSPRITVMIAYDTERVYLCEEWHFYRAISAQGLCEFLSAAVQGDAVFNPSVNKTNHHSKATFLIHELVHFSPPSQRGHLKPEVYSVAGCVELPAHESLIKLRSLCWMWAFLFLAFVPI